MDTNSVSKSRRKSGSNSDTPTVVPEKTTKSFFVYYNAGSQKTEVMRIDDVSHTSITDGYLMVIDSDGNTVATFRDWVLVKENTKGKIIE